MNKLNNSLIKRKLTGVQPQDWTKEMCQYANDKFRPLMKATIETLNGNDSRHIVFGAACYDHGILDISEFHKVNVNGVSAQDQLLAWLESGQRLEAISTCSGVNCQETCREVSTGPNSFC